MNIHDWTFLPDNVMKAKAKVPLNICGWIWIKLSSSLSFITGCFLGTWPRGWGYMMHDHFSWWPTQVKMSCRCRCLCVNKTLNSHTVRGSYLRCCSLSVISAGGTGANFELEWDKEVMDSSINQLVTHHLLTHPCKQRGTWCFRCFGSLHLPYFVCCRTF